MDKIGIQIIGIITLSIFLIGSTNICMKNHWYVPRIIVKEAYYKYNPEAKSLSSLNETSNIINLESGVGH